MRDYVDDIMLREVSHDIPTLIRKARTGLQFAKQLVRRAGLKDNEAKEHMTSRRKASTRGNALQLFRLRSRTPSVSLC